MFNVTIVLEDLHIMANDHHKVNANDMMSWDVTIFDTFKCESYQHSMTTSQLSAIAALAIGLGEEQKADPITVGALYAIARSGLENCPPSLSPIP